MSQTSLKSILSYRNAYYQGQTKDNLRNGSGVLLIDQGPIIVAQWKDDLAFGPAFLFINSEQYACLQFNRGELEGICLFRSGPQLLVIQFNNGRAIDRQIFLNYQEDKLKLLTFRNANYEVLETERINGRPQSMLIEEYLGIKMQVPSLTDYLHNNFCRNQQHFQIKILPNGTKFFRFNDRSNPISLGFVLAKNDQLSSYGAYINDKLHGFGCKYENSSKYQGQFQNGFLNGEGMRYSNGKYSYGRFENGNLVEPLFLEERSTASEERLRELRRITHLQSSNFHNGYVKKGLLRFKGISQITAMSSPVKEYLYSQFGQKQNQPQPIKGSKVSLNQLLSTKNNHSQQPEERQMYHSSHGSRGKNNEDQFLKTANNTIKTNGYGRKF